MQPIGCASRSLQEHKKHYKVNHLSCSTLDFTFHRHQCIYADHQALALKKTRQTTWELNV